jgi:hypothetical protein
VDGQTRPPPAETVDRWVWGICRFPGNIIHPQLAKHAEIKSLLNGRPSSGNACRLADCIAWSSMVAAHSVAKLPCEYHPSHRAFPQQTYKTHSRASLITRLGWRFSSPHFGVWGYHPFYLKIL